MILSIFDCVSWWSAILALFVSSSEVDAFVVPWRNNCHVNAVQCQPFVSVACTSQRRFHASSNKSPVVLHQNENSWNPDNNENDDNNSENVFFDDFDFVVGDASNDNFSPKMMQDSSLQERIREAEAQELYQSTKLNCNWKSGDWSVRGFSLDTSDAVRDAGPISVTEVASDANSEGGRIWVGRSNGSLVWVELGTEYATHFRSKLTGRFSGSENSNAKDDSGDQGNKDKDDLPSSFSAQFSSELVRESSQQPFSDDMPEFIGESATPFSILAQYSAPTNAEAAITTILSVPNEDCIFTACEGSGQIHQWHVSEDDVGSDTPTLKTPMPLSDGIHNGAIVALRLVSYKDTQLLLSVSEEGNLALWDIPKGDLIYHCRVSIDEIVGDRNDDSSEIVGDASRLVHAVDVNGNNFFLATASGYVLGYDVTDLLNSASSGGSCPLPQGRFKAHDGGVTAIACGGPGSLGRVGGGSGGGNEGRSSSVLLTGGANGVIKQW